jgi:hypothetical protein
VLSAEPAQLLTEGSVVVRLSWLVALGGAVLADDPAGQPLGDAQHALQMLHGAAARAGLRSFPGQLPQGVLLELAGEGAGRRRTIGS